MTDLTPEIRALKAERQAAIVAHNYQFAAAPDASFSDRFGGLFLRSFLFMTGHRAA
jgi:quinolinate synthase